MSDSLPFASLYTNKISIKGTRELCNIFTKMFFLMYFYKATEYIWCLTFVTRFKSYCENNILFQTIKERQMVVISPKYEELTLQTQCKLIVVLEILKISTEPSNIWGNGQENYVWAVLSLWHLLKCLWKELFQNWESIAVKTVFMSPIQFT